MPAVPVIGAGLMKRILTLCQNLRIIKMLTVCQQKREKKLFREKIGMDHFPDLMTVKIEHATDKCR